MSTFAWPPNVDGTPWDVALNPFVDHPGATDGPYRVMADALNGVVEQLRNGTGVPGRIMLNGVARYAGGTLNPTTFLATPNTTPAGDVWYLFDGVQCLIYRGNYVSGASVLPTKLSTNPAVGLVFYSEFYVRDTAGPVWLAGPRLWVIGNGGGIAPSELVLGHTTRLVTADAVIRKGDVVFVDTTAGDVELTIDAQATLGPQDIWIRRANADTNVLHVDCTYAFNPAGFDIAAGANNGAHIIDIGPSWMPLTTS